MNVILGIVFLICPLSIISADHVSLQKYADLVEQGEGASAIDSLRIILSELEESSEWNENEFALTFMLLSNAYSTEGKLKEMSDLCTYAMRIFNSKSSNPNTEFARQLWRLRGSIQMELKDYDSAISYLQHAQWMYEDESIYSNGYFTVLTLLGGCYLQKKCFTTAKLYIDEAEEIHSMYWGETTNSDFVDSYSLLNYKGLLLQSLGDLTAAEYCFQSIISAHQKDILLEGIKDIARNNLANLYVFAGKYDDAISLFKSLKITTSAAQYTNAQNIAMCALMKGDYEAATDNLSVYNIAGFNYLQSIVLNFAEIEREHYWSEISNQMMRTNNFLAMQTNREEALRMGFKINSYVRDFNLNFQSIIKKQYLKQESPQRKEIWEEYQTDLGRLSYGFESIEQHDSIALKVITTERQILSEIGFEIKNWFEYNYDIRKLSSDLSDDEIIIDFIYSSILKGDSITEGFEEGFAIYSFSKDDPYPRLTSVCKQQDLIPLIYNQEADELFINNIYTEKNDSIYKLLIEPILPIISGKKKIYLRPVGHISSINIEALTMPDGRKFGETYQIEVVSNIFNLNKNHKFECVDMALFGDPDFFHHQSHSTDYSVINIPSGAKYNLMFSGNRGNWGLLPGTRIEIERVSELASSHNIPNVKFIGKEASETAVKALSGESPSIMHFATHGYFIASNETACQNNFLQQAIGYSLGNHLMLYSGLLFTGANDVWNGNAKPNPIDDGVLTADEISRLDFSTTHLVVLSACDTGKGHQNGTDGVMGLQRAFKAAGAKTMIISLWQVPDKATSLLMQHFYTYLFSNHSVRASLRLAQEDLRSAGYREPYYWASFVVID